MCQGIRTPCSAALLAIALAVLWAPAGAAPADLELTYTLEKPGKGRRAWCDRIPALTLRRRMICPSACRQPRRPSCRRPRKIETFRPSRWSRSSLPGHPRRSCRRRAAPWAAPATLSRCAPLRMPTICTLFGIVIEMFWRQEPDRAICRWHDRPGRTGGGFWPAEGSTEPCSRLSGTSICARVSVANGATRWPNGADLAPDSMHDAIRAGGSWTVE